MINNEKIHISRGNSKLGKIPSFSFPPGITCRLDAPCLQDCYALKAWRLYSQTRDALNRNLRLYYENSLNVLNQLLHYIWKNKPKYFRFFVSGDLPDKGFYGNIKLIASLNDNTQFLMFTKKYDIPLSEHTDAPPKNLSVILSAWKDLQPPSQSLFRVAYMDDGTLPKIPNAVYCSGSCITCKDCFSPGKKNVIFKKH